MSQCPNLLWAYCHVDQAEENAYYIYIAVVSLFRLLSHLQISPKMKKGGERRGKEWRRQREEISNKTVPEISRISVQKKRKFEKMKSVKNSDLDRGVSPGAPRSRARGFLEKSRDCTVWTDAGSWRDWRQRSEWEVHANIAGISPSSRNTRQ